MGHHRTFHRVAATLLAAGLVTGAAACSHSAKPAAKPTPTTASSSAPASSTPPPPPPAPAPAMPLTGMPGPVPDRPALAIKVENSVDARPQTGLDAADVVWEEVVEGGITRFAAVYQSNLPPQVGPVRSIRPMDPSIAAPMHGLLAFSGGVQPYIDAARAAGLQVLSQDSGTPGFTRTGSRPAPHNVYADPSVLVGQADADHKAPPAAQFTFGTPPSAGAPATRLDLTMSGVSHPRWTWNGQVWQRSEGNAPAVTSDGKQLSATNVVVVRVDVVQTSARDPAGNPVPETKLVGSGDATVAVGGTTVGARWTKNAVGDPLVLTAADGSPVKLAPGNTWVELVPNGTGNVAVS